MKITEKTNRGGESHLVRIFDIAELSAHDGPGIRSVVYFQGCDTQCDWCHSPQSQQISSPLMFSDILCTNCQQCARVCKEKVHTFADGLHKIERNRCNQCEKCIVVCPNSIARVKASALHLSTVETNVKTLFAQIEPYMRLTKNDGGITLSGGEAILQTDAVKELLLLCKKSGFHTAVETSGLLPIDVYQSVAPMVDLWLFGMRVITGKDHKRHDESIRQTLRALVNSGAQILPRIPMVPGFFDRDDVLRSIISILSENTINTVCLNRWNTNYDVNYIRTNRPLKMKPPTIEEISLCKDKITNTFINSKFNVYEN